MEKITQQHETKRIEENGVFYFLKFYKPDSYEIKNEISWLTSNILKSCAQFYIPEIEDASIKDGYVKMKHIEIVPPPEKEKLLEYLTSSAIELHSLIKSPNPYLRENINASEYNNFLERFTQYGIEGVKKEFEIPEEVAIWINSQIKDLKSKYFTIVHRDLRLRHLLFSENSKPTLIDWEYTTVTEPAQDLAKLIYDCVVNAGMDRKLVFKKVIEHYSKEIRMSPEELEKKIRVFLPIVPLEHSVSFVKRKPEGCAGEVLKDLAFIKTLYEEKN